MEVGGMKDCATLMASDSTLASENMGCVWAGHIAGCCCCCCCCRGDPSPPTLDPSPWWREPVEEEGDGDGEGDGEGEEKFGVPGRWEAGCFMAYGKGNCLPCM